MSTYKEWAGGAVKVQRKEREYDAWVEGRFIMYAPTFHPSRDVKEWGGVRWDGKNQVWRVPRLVRNVRKLIEFDPEARCSRDLKQMLDPKWCEPKNYEALLWEYTEEHPTFQHLYPFQKQAVCALVRRMYHGKMLVLSPGLGKTPISAIAADLYARMQGIENPKFLVICVLPLTYNWVREVNGPIENREELPLWVQENGWSETRGITRVHGKVGIAETAWTVTNPDSLYERKRATPDSPMRATGQLDPRWNLDWDVVILDESILYKHRKAKRVGVVKTLVHSAKQVWELSGAPITHDNSDIWQQFNIAEPDYFTSFWDFTNEFCIVEQTPWSMGEIVGSRHGMELRKEYPDIMFVRNQEEEFEDLPSVIFQDIELPLTRRQKKAHDDLMEQWFHELEINADSRVEVTKVIAQLTRLQQVTSNLKNLETTGKSWPDESSKADAIEQMLETDAQFPMLIWVWHRPGAQMLKDRIEKMCSGRTKEKTKHPMYGKRVELVIGRTKGADKLIEEFKAGQVDVLILSIGVGKYGHTLANVRDVVYLDRTWDSDAMFQSLHRYAGARGKLAGYLHQPRVRILRCRGTVDDFVEMNLAGKLPDMAKITGADLLKILRSLGANYIEDLEEE